MDKMLSIEDVKLRVTLALEDISDYHRWCNMDEWDYVAFFDALEKRLTTNPAQEEIDRIVNFKLEEE